MLFIASECLLALMTFKMNHLEVHQNGVCHAGTKLCTQKKLKCLSSNSKQLKISPGSPFGPELTPCRLIYISNKYFD